MYCWCPRLKFKRFQSLMILLHILHIIYCHGAPTGWVATREVIPAATLPFSYLFLWCPYPLFKFSILLYGMQMLWNRGVGEIGAIQMAMFCIANGHTWIEFQLCLFCKRSGIMRQVSRRSREHLGPMRQLQYHMAFARIQLACHFVPTQGVQRVPRRPGVYGQTLLSPA